MNVSTTTQPYPKSVALGTVGSGVPDVEVSEVEVDEGPLRCPEGCETPLTTPPHFAGGSVEGPVTSCNKWLVGRYEDTDSKNKLCLRITITQRSICSSPWSYVYVCIREKCSIFKVGLVR